MTSLDPFHIGTPGQRRRPQGVVESAREREAQRCAGDLLYSPLDGGGYPRPVNINVPRMIKIISKGGRQCGFMPATVFAVVRDRAASPQPRFKRSVGALIVRDFRRKVHLSCRDSYSSLISCDQRLDLATIVFKDGAFHLSQIKLVC